MITTVVTTKNYECPECQGLGYVWGYEPCPKCVGWNGEKLKNKGMKTFVKLTPHTVNLINPKTNKVICSFPSEGAVRVGMESNYEEICGVPQGKVKYTELEGLPKPKKGVVYILSTIAFNAAKEKGRKDICFPAGKMFRDEGGKISGMEFLSFDN